MLTEPLPTSLDVRKAAAREVEVAGLLQPRDLQRFRALLAADEGAIEVFLTFSQDEEKRSLIGVKLQADVIVTCQRCLEPMHRQLRSDNTLAVVFTDEQAARLPRHLDPLIVEDQACNLWDVVEDELILAMPPFSYHDIAECSTRVADFSDAASDMEPQAEKPNPFDVLAQLKSGKE